MSGNANIIVIEGRLTKAPNFMKTKNGKLLCKFSIANNRYYYTDGSLQKEVYFFDLISWGYKAEKVASLNKGSHVLISGELRQNSYLTKEGVKRNSIYILALEIKNLDKKSLDSDGKIANNQTVTNIIDESMEQVF